MTFSKTYPAGVSAGMVVTHQAFQDIDEKTALAVDKRGDTIDAAATITWPSGSTCAFSLGSTLTISTLGAHLAGKLNVDNLGYINVDSGGLIQWAAGSTATIAGTLNVVSTGIIKTGSGGRIQLNDADWIELADAPRALTSRMLNLGASPLESIVAGWTQTSDGVTSGAAGAAFAMAVPQLHDAAALVSIDVFVLPDPVPRVPSSAGSFALKYRAPAAGAPTPLQNVGGATGSLTSAGWGDGQVKQITLAIGATVSAANVYLLSVVDESGGGYTGGNKIQGVAFNYTIADCRPS